MKETVTYNHQNGYSAVLYGISSMSIFRNGKEVMHTGFRKVNTEAEVIRMLEALPRLMNGLGKIV